MDNFNNFNNLDSSIRKSSIIQERMTLVSTHMYRQYLEYEKSMLNMNEVFFKMQDNLEVIIEYLKQSFISRGVSTQNIKYEIDSTRTVIVVNILWHQFSVLIRYNDFPQALHRDGEPLFASRIIAIKGNYFEIIKKAKENDIEAVLEFETASLYIPAEKSKHAIMKIKHLGSKEFHQSQIDAPRDFILKVIELTCGGGLVHKECVKKNITLEI